MKRIALILLTALLLSSCGQTNNAESPGTVTTSETVSSTGTSDTTAQETTASILSETVTESETVSAEDKKLSELRKFLNDMEWRFYSNALFCDIDLDGHNELLLEGGIDRSFSTYVYTIYKLNNDIPEFYGRIDSERSESKYTDNTIFAGKLQRYFDNEQGVYIIFSDSTSWGDGSFGNVNYFTCKSTLYSDRIKNETVSNFWGTSCRPAEHIRDGSMTDYSYIDDWVYVYDENVGMVRLGSTDKFADISDIMSRFEFIDTIDLDELERYNDIDQIAGLISEYSGYEYNADSIPCPVDVRKEIGITDMGGHEITARDTHIDIAINDISDLEWDKICKVDDLREFHLDYYGEEELDIDLSPLKKYENLTALSLYGNFSEDTKRQVSGFLTLEYVNMWGMILSSEEDFKYIKDLPKLKYIAIASDNDDPDYFKFLYDNTSIEWLRFDNSVTDEQVKNTVDNMPNLIAVTFGFSEV
ncbi:MAG: hypothetical protein J1F11_10825 [Oscillospiraceae bacterium]|nr:hypothetical protein [Oscillospiraceae bacterium]